MTGEVSHCLIVPLSSLLESGQDPGFVSDVTDERCARLEWIVQAIQESHVVAGREDG